MRYLAVSANAFAPFLAFLALVFPSGEIFSKQPSDEVHRDFSTQPIQQPGMRGGTLVISSHSEPKTLNPLLAIGSTTRKVIGLLNADLIHINSATQQTEPALAESWTVTDGGRRYVMRLRQGVHFSDGSTFDADDVVFTFRAYLDERVQSPQRDLLIVAGKPIQAKKIGQYTVAFLMNEPYAAAERLFDGIAMLPRHLLERQLARGTLRSNWTLATNPSEIAGLGPFRFAMYKPGQRIILERNPFYWKRDKAGTQLPYLDRISMNFVASTDAEVMRFEQGETDLIDNLDAQSFALLERRQGAGSFRALDLGAGLEYDFLFFNQNALTSEPFPHFFERQKWFAETGFRKAVSDAIDREALVRIAYFGRADALATVVTPGNRKWIDPAIPKPVRSLSRARHLLSDCGFSWSKDNLLLDPAANPVRFAITYNASKPQQAQMATLIQQDLRDIGIRVDLDGVEPHTLSDRVFSTHRYEAAMIGLAGGDADPNSELNVVTSTGTAHIWRLKSTAPASKWQAEIDQLMKKQLITTNFVERRNLYNRVQELMWENMPMICLVSPHVLVAAKNTVENFHPAILGSQTLWNSDRLFLRR